MLPDVDGTQSRNNTRFARQGACLAPTLGIGAQAGNGRESTGQLKPAPLLHVSLPLCYFEAQRRERVGQDVRLEAGRVTPLPLAQGGGDTVDVSFLRRCGHTIGSANRAEARGCPWPNPRQTLLQRQVYVAASWCWAGGRRETNEPSTRAVLTALVSQHA